MSVLSTSYARVGFTTTLSPPLSGIYYVSIAVYNAPTQAFTVQNGVSQNTLSGQSAQLFEMPSSGSAMALQPFPNNYPYGAYLGPLQAVWYEPSDSSGSYPVTLGALAGLVQWTPVVTLDTADPIYVVPGAPINSIVISDASDTSETITITGVQSSTVVGTGVLGGNTSVTIPLDVGTGDSVFAITASAPITAIVSLIVGVAPVATAGGGGGGGDMANTPDPLRFSYAGDLTAGVGDDTDVPGGLVSCPPGSQTFITRLWALILGGASVDVTVRVNSAPSYAGSVAVPGLDPITVTPTPGGFVLPTALQVFDLDYVDIVLSNLVGTPAGLVALADVLVVPPS